MFPANRSMPPGAVIPVLGYPDVFEAAAWLCRAFGFVERLRIGDHRIQLVIGEGSVVVTGLAAGTEAAAAGLGHSVMVRVTDANQHCKTAEQAGARIVNPPTDYPFGERQYTAEDPGGHRWTFSQTIADSDPQSWGGVLVAAT